jgi:hypothetical protein
VSSEHLDFVSAWVGEKFALAYSYGIFTTPIAWECPAHDGFFDSDISMHWPRMEVPPEVEQYVVNVRGKVKPTTSFKTKDRKRQ